MVIKATTAEEMDLWIQNIGKQIVLKTGVQASEPRQRSQTKRDMMGTFINPVEFEELRTRYNPVRVSAAKKKKLSDRKNISRKLCQS